MTGVAIYAQADRIPMLNVPILLPDQTIESACATAWAMNGWARWRDATRYVFGSSGIRPERMLHGGIVTCFKVLARDEFKTPEIFIERHGFVSITKPFMDPTNYDFALWKMGQTDKGIGGVGNVYWPKLVHSQRQYCRACVDKEIKDRGFAYTHRSHQIIGALVCHAHGERLTPLNAAESDNLAAHGFLTHSAFGTNTWRLGEPTCYKPVGAAHRRLAQFIKAALDGELPRISYELRHSIIAHKSKTYIAKGRCGHAQLEALQRRVDECFSTVFLGEIRAEFLAKLNDHVSQIILGHIQFVENPLANLAMLAVLFESPRQFCREIEQYRLKSVGDSSVKPINEDAVPPTFELARELFRSLHVAQASRKYGIDYAKMKNYLALRPSLASRRRLAIAKRKRRNARSALFRFLTTHPNGRQNDFRLSDRSNFHWLYCYDKECLNELLPV